MKWLTQHPSSLVVGGYIIGIYAHYFNGWMAWVWIICGMSLMGIWSANFTHNDKIIYKLLAMLKLLSDELPR